MPAKTERQRKLMGMALSYKRGQLNLRGLPKSTQEKIRRIAKSMTEEQLRDYAKKG